jgi:OmpA-OmpF porin, OOP family
MKSIGWLAGAALMFSAHCASAQGTERFYVGASAGASDMDNSVATGLITSGTVDGNGSGSKIYAGFRGDHNLALEFAWVDLGEARYGGTYYGAPVTGGKVKISGLNLSVVGLVPATPHFQLFAKAGLYAWQAQASDVTGGVPFSDSIDSVNLSLGLGANYYFAENIGARIEWEHFDLDLRNAWGPSAADLGSAGLLSAGIVVRF